MASNVALNGDGGAMCYLNQPSTSTCPLSGRVLELQGQSGDISLVPLGTLVPTEADFSCAWQLMAGQGCIVSLAVLSIPVPYYQVQSLLINDTSTSTTLYYLPRGGATASGVDAFPQAIPLPPLLTSTSSAGLYINFTWRLGNFLPTQLDFSTGFTAHYTQTCVQQGGVSVIGDYHTIVINNSTLRDNTASGNGGGFIFNVSAGFSNAASTNVAINQSRIIGNAASGDGGGGVINLRGTLTATSTVVADNTCELDGGGLSVTGPSVSFSSSAFMRNVASSGDGGGLCLTDSPSLFVSGCNASSNVAGSHGGSFLCSNVTAMEWVSCTISSNSVSGRASAVSADLIGSAVIPCVACPQSPVFESQGEYVHDSALPPAGFGRVTEEACTSFPQWPHLALLPLLTAVSFQTPAPDLGVQSLSGAQPSLR